MNLRVIDLSDEHTDYLSDESRREGSADKIVFPKSTTEVCKALRIATEKNWPVTVQGGRTGITGGCVPASGLILNLSRMNNIDSVKGDSITVQPGALLADIRATVAESDDPAMFFPSDLTETTASIGGMVANNASGARSFKYGAVRNWIQVIEVVLPNGEIERLVRGVHKADGYRFKIGNIEGSLPDIHQPKRVKSAAGYYIEPDMDLVDLFIGAEGTLGIVTEITLKLLPEPDQMNGLTAFFDSEIMALQFVQFLRAESTNLPTAIEFFDSNALNLLRRMKDEISAFADLPDLKSEFHTAIYFEFEGDVPEAVIDKVDETIECWFSEGNAEIEKLKQFRHAVPESVNMLISERKKEVPELTKLGTDMSVPDERLVDVMQMYHEGLSAAELEYVIFGHVGNNHVHVNILPRSMEEHERGKALYLDWAQQVVKWDGSVSAEHGIGKNKVEFLTLMFGEEGVRQMKDLKAFFDPEGLLNPGNLFE